MTPRAWVVVALVAAACDRRASPLLPAPTPSASATTSSPPPLASASASARAPAYGPWVRCYGGFRPTDAPATDLQRLAMLCGPTVGMRAAWPIAEGALDERAPPATHALSLGRGECARVFAVASAGISDLDVQLVSPDGAVVVEDAIDDRWPVVPPDRAACVLEPGAYVVRVRARKGKGAYAVQAWVLP